MRPLFVWLALYIIPLLNQHIQQPAIMRGYHKGNWKRFDYHLKRAYPVCGNQAEMDLGDE